MTDKIHTAKKVPYSSIVGQSIMLLNEAGPVNAGGTMTKIDRVPITDEWLSSCDFKWRQSERQPNKHWSLVLNIVGDRSGCIEPTTIEVQRCGWQGRTEYIGDPTKWSLWVKDRFERSAYLTDIQWQSDIIGMAEIITRRPWNPETHIYGQAWPEGSKALEERATNDQD